MKADLIGLEGESVDTSQDLTIFDPIATWKRMTLPAGGFTVRELMEPVFVEGRCCYRERTMAEIMAYAAEERDTLWEEHKRLIRPQIMPVDLSQKLYDLKQEMITQLRTK